MSAVDFSLNAELRDDQGKGASRRLRRENKVPGIIYGAGKEPLAISVAHNELWHHLEHEAFYSHILTINVDGKKEEGILKDLQRHPAKALLLHFDIQRIKRGEKLRTSAPLHFINEDKCPGVKAGGIVNRTITELEIEVLPKDLPEYIEVDLAGLEIGGAVHLSEITLPKGVELVTHGELDEAHDQSVVSIQEPKVEKVEDESAADDAVEAAPEADGEESGEE